MPHDTHRLHRAYLLSTVLTVASSSAFAGTPVGLVISLTGTTDPNIRPYTEIESGTNLHLNKNTQIQFIHYAVPCREAVVTGGDIQFTDKDFKVIKGSIDSTITRTCPHRVKVKEPTISSGTVMRGNSAVTQQDEPLSTTPECTMLGTTSAIMEAQIFNKDHQTVAHLNIEGTKLKWPHNVKPLDYDSRYLLEIEMSGANHKKYTQNFVTIKDPSVETGLCLLPTQ